MRVVPEPTGFVVPDEHDPADDAAEWPTDRIKVERSVVSPAAGLVDPPAWSSSVSPQA